MTELGRKQMDGAKAVKAEVTEFLKLSVPKWIQLYGFTVDIAEINSGVICHRNRDSSGFTTADHNIRVHLGFRCDLCG